MLGVVVVFVDSVFEVVRTVVLVCVGVVVVAVVVMSSEPAF